MYVPLSDDGADDVPLVLELLEHVVEDVALGVVLGAAVLERAAQTHRAVVLRVLRAQRVLEDLTTHKHSDTRGHAHAHCWKTCPAGGVAADMYMWKAVFYSIVFAHAHENTL